MAQSPVVKTVSTFYEVLGVGPTAETETLRKAYRRLARKHHPDVSSDPRAHENMARINEAFETLIDPSRRVEYDARLAGGTYDEDTSHPYKTPQRPVVVKLLNRLQGHKTPVYALSYAPDTGQLVSSGFDNEIIWWNPQTGFPTNRTRVEAGVVSTLRAFSLDRVAAAGSAETQVSFCRIEEGKLEAWRTANEEWVGSVAISPDGQAIATGSIHHTMSVIRASDGMCLYRRADHDDAVTAVAWSSDGQVLASGSADATVKLYDSASGALLQTIRQIRGPVTALAVSADKHYIAAAGVDLSIRVFDLTTMQLVKMMFGHTKVIESLAFHPNGWLFASGARDGTVGLWNAAKGIGNVRLECSSRPISCVTFSHDGSRLAAGGQDRLVRVWEVAAKQTA